MSIELIATDALLKEIANRHDTYIFVGIHKDPKGDNYDIYKSDWNGGISACIGLCEILKGKLHNEVSKDMDGE